MKLAVLLSLATTVSAHNWLMAPPSYNGNKASTTKPCAAKAANYEPLKAAANEAVEFKWSVNHSGDHWIKVVAAADAANVETIAEGDAKMVFYSKYGNKVPTGEVKIPTGGDYLAVYGWSGYRNCVEIKVAAAGPTPAPPAGCSSDEECRSTSGILATCDATSKACQCPMGVTMNKEGVCIAPQSTKPNCEEYCLDAMTQCTEGNAIFKSREACLATCATYPAGTYGDTLGNSLACRFYHLHVEGGDPAVHCPHASKEGGLKCTGGDTADFVAAISFTVIGEPDLSQSLLTALIQQAIIETEYGAKVDVQDVIPAEKAGEFTVSLQFKGTTEEAEAAAAEYKTGASPLATAVQAKMTGEPKIVSQSLNTAEGTDNTDMSGASTALPAFAMAGFALVALLF
jgi:hypothetical protein